jgi:hypothetical protein
VHACMRASPSPVGRDNHQSSWDTSGALDIRHDRRTRLISRGTAVLDLSLISVLQATWKHGGPERKWQRLTAGKGAKKSFTPGAVMVKELCS